MNDALKEMSHAAIRELAREVQKQPGNPLAHDLAVLLERLLDELKAASNSRSIV